jgi:hypothetical protein
MSVSDVPSFGQEHPAARRRRERNPVTWIIIAVLALVVLYSCGHSAYDFYRIGGAATDRLHQELNQAQYDDIYAGATDEFRNHGSRAETLPFLERVHQTMGNVHQSKLKGFNINRNTSGTLATLVYATTFDKGNADEQFVWQIESDAAKLYGYRIDAPNFH